VRKHYPKWADPEVYDIVVSVARSYNRDTKKIREIENDLIMATSRPNGEGGRSSYVSDPTYNIMAQIDKQTALLRYRTDAVEKALRTLTDEEQDIIKTNLLKIYCKKDVSLTHCNTQKSEITCKRIRKKFLNRLAVELGEIL